MLHQFLSLLSTSKASQAELKAMKAVLDVEIARARLEASEARKKKSAVKA